MVESDDPFGEPAEPPPLRAPSSEQQIAYLQTLLRMKEETLGRARSVYAAADQQRRALTSEIGELRSRCKKLEGVEQDRKQYARTLAEVETRLAKTESRLATTESKLSETERALAHVKDKLHVSELQLDSERQIRAASDHLARLLLQEKEGWKKERQKLLGDSQEITIDEAPMERQSRKRSVKRPK